jgi:hypothetical protein
LSIEPAFLQGWGVEPVQRHCPFGNAVRGTIRHEAEFIRADQASEKFLFFRLSNLSTSR